MNNKTKITKDTVVTFGILSEAVDAILKGVQSMFDEHAKKIDKRFDSVELTAKYNHDSLQKEIQEIKYDTPTLRQFNQLKDKVERVYPTL